MFCTECGAKLPEDAVFCPHCGHPVEHIGGDRSAAAQSASAGDVTQADSSSRGDPERDPASPADLTAVLSSAGMPQEQTTESVRTEVAQPSSAVTTAMPKISAPAPKGASSESAAADVRSRGRGRKIAPIVVIAAVILSLIGGGAWYFLGVRQQQDASAEQDAHKKTHRGFAVKLDISAPGLSSPTGTKIPVQVSGKDFEGRHLNKTFYAAADGSGIRLGRGDYDFSVSASPIAADGTIYATDDVKTHGVVGKKGSFKTNGPLTLTAIEAVNVTDAQIEAAYRAAKNGGASGEDAATALRDLAIRRRDDAIAKEKEEKEAAAKKAAEERAAARHFETSRFSFDIPAYWQDRVTVEIDGADAHIMSKKYPKRMILSLYLIHEISEAPGQPDKISAKPVPLGDGSSAQATGPSWAFLIGMANIERSKDPQDFYTLDEANELTDLQTGGRVAYKTILRSMKSTGLKSLDMSVFAPVEQFVSETIPQTIKAR